MINEWIPEHMQPGTVFVLGKRRRSRRKGRPLLGRAGLPILRHARINYPPPDQRPCPGNLRLRKMSAQFFIRDSEVIVRKPF